MAPEEMPGGAGGNKPACEPEKERGDAASLPALIRRQIRLGGPLTVAAYMNLALSHPVHGYYMKKDPFGRAGDFTTAPEISQMFGELIGAFVAGSWMQLGSPARFALVEGGPGRGTLMADALRATRRVKGFHESISLHLLETSPYLIERQREKLRPYAPQWHASLATVPQDMPLVFIANELLDALPIRQLQKKDGIWRERVVGLDDEGRFTFGLLPAPADILAFIPADQRAAPDGAVFEYSPARERLAFDVASRIGAGGGAALFIDYGPAVFGCGDTLQAMKSHEFVPVLETPGDADITSHVDFGAIARAGRGANVNVFGPEEQRLFLGRLGVNERAEALKQIATDAQKRDIDKAVQRLCAPDQMGALFKALAFTPPAWTHAAGF